MMVVILRCLNVRLVEGQNIFQDAVVWVMELCKREELVGKLAWRQLIRLVRVLRSKLGGSFEEGLHSAILVAVGLLPGCSEVDWVIIDDRHKDVDQGGVEGAAKCIEEVLDRLEACQSDCFDLAVHIIYEDPD